MDRIKEAAEAAFAQGVRDGKRLASQHLKQERKKRAARGWFNWYLTRRRMDFDGSEIPKQMRQVSWRRAH